MNESTSTGLEIAVIGMSGRFPGASDIHGFWENIKNGVNSVTYFSGEELLEVGVEPELLENPNYVKARSVMEGIEYFDAPFFGYTPKEAAVMDPQARVFHECVWTALEDGGYDPAAYNGLIGLYAGGTYSLDWQMRSLGAKESENVGHFTAGILAHKDFMSMRLSYQLNLTGPSFVLYTACSTSLVAVHLACQAILNGECDMALAGGVTITALEKGGYLYQQGMIGSSDGRCKTFDQKGDGIVAGNGAGVVLLKRLEDAIADKDHIYAVVKGSAINNDGSRKLGFTAPSVEGQAEVINMAYQLAEVEPDTVSYIEAHGTGTELGDPIELEGLKLSFGTSRKSFCAVASVKTNIGHVDSAAGIAGFIKAALALKYKQIPPSLHFNTPNANIDFIDSPFYVNTRLQEWQPGQTPRRAGISSLGIGGTNAHVVLEEPPTLSMPAQSSRKYQSLLLSAINPGALQRNIRNLGEFFKEHPDCNLADAAYTSQVGRRSFPYRHTVVCTSTAEAAEILSSQGRDPLIKEGRGQAKQPVNTVFLFPGEDRVSLYVNLGLGLYREEPVFQEALDICFRQWESLSGQDLKLLLYPRQSHQESTFPPEAKGALVFSIAYGLAKLLEHWKILPSAVYGDGAGEYAAACMAGVFSLSGALQLLYAHGHSVDYKNKLAQISPGHLKIPYLSGASGQWTPNEATAEPRFWESRQELQPTERDDWGDILKPLSDLENPVLLSLLPLLSPPGQSPEQFMESIDAPIFDLLPGSRPEPGDQHFLLEQIGRFWRGGGTVDWEQFHGQGTRRRVSIPTYSFDKQRYWLDQVSYVRQDQADGTARIKESKDMADWFYLPSWKLAPLTFPKHRPAPGKAGWLVFSNSLDLEQGLLERLKELGRVTVVTQGDHFLELKERLFSVNIRESNHYELLFRRLADLDAVPDHILHLWSVSGGEPTPVSIENFEETQYSGFFSLIYIARAIDALQSSKDTDITMLTDHMQEVIGGEPLDPRKSTLLGPVTVIPQEYAGLQCRSVDIQLPAPGSNEESGLLDALLKEFCSPVEDPVVAYRHHRRWVQAFESLPIEAPGDNAISFRENGVYLIPGGLGAIGMMFARMLAHHTNARLIMTGRSDFPDRENRDSWLNSHDESDKVSRKIIQLRKLEDMGAKILYFKADIADHEEMQQVINRGESAFGPINGVIHSAGILEMAAIKSIRDLSYEDCQLQFHAKVYGLLVLENLLRDKELDFRWLVSSISCVLGGLGFGAYAAASQFMDLFTKWRNRTAPSRWFSLNWDGMGAEESIDAFQRLFTLELPGQVVFSKGGNLESRIEKWVKLAGVKGRGAYTGESEASLHPRPPLPTPYLSPRNSTEQAVADIWKGLLGYREIGVKDDFLELGGDSLRAITLLSRVHQELKVNIPLTEFFDTPTVEFISRNIENSSEESAYTGINPTETMEYYPVSPAQQRLFILQQMEEDLTSYNISMVLTLEGDIDKEKMNNCFRRLVRHHESFRTSFLLVDDRPVQQVRDEVPFQMEYFDLYGGGEAQTGQGSGPFSENSENERIAQIIAGFIRPYDMSCAPLLKSGLIKARDKHILIVDMHHIISDGVSLDIFVRDFERLYSGDFLPAPRLQYKDYSQWLLEGKQNEAYKKQEKFWMETFAGEYPVLNLPLDFSRPPIQNFDGRLEIFCISPEDTRALHEIARLRGGTLFMVLSAFFDILLAKSCHQEESIVGTPAAGRRHADLQQIIGFFINTVVLTSSPSGEKPFSLFLDEVKKRTLSAFENQEYPFEELVEKVVLRRELNRNPLFDVMFVMENMYSTPTTQAPPSRDNRGLRIKPYQFERVTSQFDLTLRAVETDGQLHLSFEYCTKLFRPETIKGLTSHFNQVIHSVLEGGDPLIKDIPIITPKEQEEILYGFNNTAAPYPTGKAIHEFLRRQAVENPGQTALMAYRDQVRSHPRLNYAEFDQATDLLARQLMDKGIASGSIVGLLTQRSVEMMVGIFGIVKAGGAYLPIDPGYPAERINFILADSRAHVLLTGTGQTGGVSAEIPVMEISVNSLVQQDPSTAGTSCPTVDAQNTAYVIYTSGTTGKPKGALIQHDSLVNRLNWMQSRYPLEQDDIILHKTPFTFDVSVWEIFWWSMAGASVCLAAVGAERDPALLAETIEDAGATVMHFVPSMLSVFLDYLEETGNTSQPASLKQVFASGEALTVPQVEKFNRLLFHTNGTRLSNLYGPTEATIDVSYFDCSTGESFDKIPIGKPIHNTGLLVLDPYLNLQPVGVVGQLFIAGVGLARGYLNRPELTAEKFTVESAFDPAPSPEGAAASRLYKTGDLARRLPDGNIEFLGRIDHQIKIRGFRIELGEIENRLTAHQDVKEAVVLCRDSEGGDPFLCAYITGSQGIEQLPGTDELTRHLSELLPDYMVPAYIVPLTEIPLTSNGKVNRKALPMPDIEAGPVFTPPRNPGEQKLVDIWADLLSIDSESREKLREKIGIDDNFFHMGGHSLKATVMVSRIHSSFDVRIPLAQIFKTPTIRGLASFIQQCGKTRYSAIEASENKEYYSLSPAQMRLYILQQMEPGSTTYNLPMVAMIEGPLDVTRADALLKLLVQRHEALRTSFRMFKGAISQVIHPTVDFELEVFPGHSPENRETIASAIKGFLKPFDLAQAPLFRAGVIPLEKDKHILMIDMHHTVSDGISITTLIREFTLLYKKETLPPLPIRYRDYSEWLNGPHGTRDLKAQETYWLDVFKGEVPVLEMPLDFDRPGKKSFSGEYYSFEISESLTPEVLQYTEQQGVTLFMLLIAVYDVLLHKYSGQADIVVGSPVSGRRSVEVEDIVGVFVNMLALRNLPDPQKVFTQFLEEVKTTALDAYDNQDYSFDNLVTALGLQGERSRNPLFDMALVFQELKESIPIGGELKISPYPAENKVSRFDMLLDVRQLESHIAITVEYASDLFKPASVERFSRHYLEILRQVVENKDIKLEDITISMELQTADSIDRDIDFDF